MSIRLAPWALLLAAAVAHADPATVLLVGDSTLAPGSGYGDALCARLEPALACVNLGQRGRSTLSYRAEGWWDRALARLPAPSPAPAPAPSPSPSQPAANPPSHVLIQFGHNDQPGKPGRSTDLATEYPANLARYAAEVRAAGAVPVLVTPLTRRSFKDGQLTNDLQPWAEAMRQVAREQQVALVDLYAISGATVRAMGSEQADRLATAAPGQPGFDRTHVGARGACVFAEQAAAELARAVAALALPRTPAVDCASLPPP